MKGHDFPKDKEGELLNFEPMGKSHVLAVKLLLTYSPFLVSSVKYHIKTFCWLVEGSYCWEVVCGRTASPFPHAHSTSRLFHFTWAGKTRCKFFFHSRPSSRGDSRSLFSSRSELEEWPQGHDLCCVFISLLTCGSDHVNSPPRGLFFLPHAAEKPIVFGFPMILVCCGFIYIFGMMWVLIEFFWPW